MQPNISSRRRFAAAYFASRPFAASTLAAWVAALAFAFSAPASAAPHSEITLPEVSVGKLAFLNENQEVRVMIDVACSGRWEVVEGTVHVGQGGEVSADALIPAECGPIRGRPYEVIVPAIQTGFEPGLAEATATLVLEDPDTGAKTTLQDVATIDIRTKRGRRAPGD